MLLEIRIHTTKFIYLNHYSVKQFVNVIETCIKMCAKL